MSEFILLVPAVLMLALGVLGLIFALLLKPGRLKPGSPWAGGFQTPLGGLLVSIGLLGCGLLWVRGAFDESAVFESRLWTPVYLLILIMIVGGIVGFRIEGKAHKARKARYEAND